ncbi:HD family phosphohydrolase [Bacillus gobiensis]|uniref:HD family phosphohydrolase n=1 Tax=Bacillus gobiensis TaxID=1441095 RepID=UPI003D1CD2AA
MKKNENKESSRLNRMKHFRFLHYILYGFLAALLFFLLFFHIRPETLDLDLFSVSDQTIYSPSTVEDEQATENRKREAVDEVKDQYVMRKDFSDNQVDLVASIFSSIAEVKAERDEKSKNEGSPPDDKTLIDSVKKQLTKDVNDALSDDIILSLLNTSNEELENVKDYVITTVNSIMGNEISIEEIEEAKNSVNKELKNYSIPSELQNAAVTVGRYAIIPNHVYDPKGTEQKRQDAADNVQPVQIKQGQILVEENQLIDREVYRKLQLAGLLDGSDLYRPVTGLLLLIGLFIAVMAYYFQKQDKPITEKNKSLLLYSLIFVITILLMEVISLFQQMDYRNTAYLVPVAMGGVLIKLLLDEKIAILSSIIFAICGSIMFNDEVTGAFNFVAGIYLLISSISGVLFLGKHNARAKILQTGLYVSIINTLVMAALLFIQNTTQPGWEIGTNAVMCIFSGVASSVLAIGLTPFFETGFGLLSTIRLIELSNPNHPLLRKILTETPGTYHHSVMVANLSEAACEAVGANGLLARVGAYYHDIGKTKRPQYFIENQMNIDNPHDKLSPQLSKNIIISHAVDGANMLRNHKMPKELVDIAEQHHGTSLLKFFFYKAKEKGDRITEEEFRYPGPKPQSKEAAIISIADSVEAAVRSMHNPNPDRIEKLVRAIISDKLQDNQFSECDLTFKELNNIAKTLCETLQGIFHSRIEYPESVKQKVKQA